MKHGNQYINVYENTVNWDLDNANESYFDYEYSCVEKFSSSHSFNEVNAKFNLDIHVITEIAKVFASHVSLPKEGFVEHVELLKQFLYICSNPI
jgi:hypothetical protein